MVVRKHMRGVGPVVIDRTQGPSGITIEKRPFNLISLADAWRTLREAQLGAPPA